MNAGLGPSWTALLLGGCAMVLAVACRAAGPDRFPLHGVDPDAFRRMDADPALARLVGEDRVLVWLVRTARSGDPAHRINRTLLEQVITRSLRNGSALESMGRDLALGDARLRAALETLFRLAHFSAGASDEAIRRWAEGRPPEQVRAALAGAAGRASFTGVLFEHAMSTPAAWSRALSALDHVLEGRSALTPDLLALSWVLSRQMTRADAEAVIRASEQESLRARFVAAARIQPLVARRGAVGRFLESAPGSDPSWTDSIWREFGAMVAGDPLLLKEYWQRTGAAQELFEVLREQLAAGMERDPTGRWGEAVLDGASLPRSRWAWLAAEAARRAPEPLEGSKAPGRLQKLAAEQIRNDPAFACYVMWHFTRPAEVLSLAIRHALPAMLAERSETAQLLLDEIELANPALHDLLEETAAFTFYGDPAEFRRRRAAGRLDPEALRQFGREAGTLLAQDDAAWIALCGTGSRATRARRGITLDAVLWDVRALRTLVQTMQRNDLSLRTAFADWLVAQGRAVSRPAFHRWLDGVAQNLEDRLPAGRQSLSEFKAWFAEFVAATHGQHMFERRLSLESTGVPESQRCMMAGALSESSAGLWRTVRLLSAHPAESAIGRTWAARVRHWAIRARLHERLLAEVGASNLAAADVVHPIWTELLAEGSPLLTHMETMIANGAFLSDLFAVHSAAIIEALETSEPAATAASAILRRIAALPDDAPFPTVRHRACERLRLEAPTCEAHLAELLQIEPVRAPWLVAFRRHVAAGGRAAIVADVILRTPPLQPVWTEALTRLFAREPMLIEASVAALEYQRVESSSHGTSTRALTWELSRLIAEDRILFEQIIAAPSGSAEQALATASRRHLTSDR